MVAINPQHPSAFLKRYPDASLIIGSVEFSPLQVLLSSESHNRFATGRGTSLRDIFECISDHGDKIDDNSSFQVNVESIEQRTTRLDILHFHGMETTVVYDFQKKKLVWDVRMKQGCYKTSFTSIDFWDGFTSLERRTDATYVDIARNLSSQLAYFNSARDADHLGQILAAQYAKACAECRKK